MTSPDPLSVLRDDPANTGVLFDFDGTLSEIVDDPDLARPLAGAPALLTRLCARFGRVGVVSGRPAAFLAEWFGGTGVWLSGLYGMEHAIDRTIVADPEAEAWRPVVDEAAARAERDGPAGMNVERKGLSVTLHFRTEPEVEAAVRAWVAAEAERSGLAVHNARKSVELRPPVPCSKGTAVRAAAAGLTVVCFTGDDLGDLEAFDALDELAAEGISTVRIAVRSDEVPAELLARADLTVDGPAGVVDLFERLLA